MTLVDTTPPRAHTQSPTPHVVSVVQDESPTPGEVCVSNSIEVVNDDVIINCVETRRLGDSK